jgi:radical SAM protein with 4Fe4S-binding SPASM domain
MNLPLNPQDPFFKIVEIEINSACNLACSYCPNREFERIEKGVMDLEHYDRILTQLVAINFQGRISHEFYGEPTLHPHLVEIITRTKVALPETLIYLYTNGTRLSKEMFNSLFKAGIDLFVVTKQEETETIIFDETIKSLKDEELACVQYRKYDEMTLTNRGGTMLDIGIGPQNLLPCYIPSMLICITVKGEVLPCFEDFFQKHSMGNIFKEDLLSIWHKEEFKKFRGELRHGLRHKHEACKNCNRIQTKIPEEFKEIREAYQK